MIHIHYLIYLLIFILTLYLIMFKFKNKCHFVTYMLTRVTIFITYYGTTISSKDRKEF